MATVTLSDLILSAKRFSDLENSNYIQDDEWTDYVNFGINQYWNKINQVLEDYNIAEVFFTTNNGQTDYPLPATPNLPGFMYVRGVDVAMTPLQDPMPSNTVWFALKPYEFKERTQYNYPWFNNYNGMYSFSYRIMSDFIRFLPPPLANVVVRLSYIPVAPLMAEAGDSMNGYNGFDVYISALAAYRAQMKQEFDTTYIEKVMAEWEKTIQTQAQDRNRDIGDKVCDIRNRGWYNVW